ncbi:hypothetical protein [Bradyrhizobium sp. 27S5]|uniref:hypothetical protein n=1 Tax=Bradyrhizobium sp. 27S5 TaxID=3139728 RepID=UPI0030D5F202
MDQDPPESTKADGVKRFLPLKVGISDVANIDFYYIDFKPPSGETPETMFKKIRLAFPEFAAGKGAVKEFAFGPYRGSLDANDKFLKANTELWNKTEPLGALMTFLLGTKYPHSARLFAGDYQAAPGSVGLFEKAGDVQVTCASPTDFIFTTVDTKVGKVHPVAGNRGFGIQPNPDGTFRFYSMAADRQSDSFPVRLAGWTGDDVFCQGHDFWILFYSNMKSFLKTKNSAVLTNHGPVKYPFDENGNHPALDCTTSQK